MSHEDEQVPGRNQPGQPAREYRRWQVLYVELSRDEVDEALATYDTDYFYRAFESYTGEGSESLRSLLIQWMNDLSALTAPDIGGDTPF